MTHPRADALPATSADWTLPSRSRVGVICLICTEAALFTIFAVAYLFYLGKSVSGPQPRQILEIPVWSTVCLLSSSATIMKAERALRRGFVSRFNLWWLLTLLLGAEFLRATASEWHRLIFTNNLTSARACLGRPSTRSLVFTPLT